MSIFALDITNNTAMNDLIIDYNVSKGSQIFTLVSRVSITLLLLNICITEALNSNYSFLFYASLVCTILAITLILSITVWRPKPLLCITDNQLITCLPDQKNIPTIEWNDVVKVGIGISFVTLKTKKEYRIDLSNLKYKDLKDVKSKIIEICEIKKIDFQNN